MPRSSGVAIVPDPTHVDSSAEYVPPRDVSRAEGSTQRTQPARAAKLHRRIVVDAEDSADPDPESDAGSCSGSGSDGDGGSGRSSGSGSGGGSSGFGRKNASDIFTSLGITGAIAWHVRWKIYRSIVSNAGSHAKIFGPKIQILRFAFERHVVVHATPKMQQTKQDDSSMSNVHQYRGAEPSKRNLVVPFTAPAL